VRQARRLEHLLDDAAKKHPDRIAVEDESGSAICYRDLVHLSEQCGQRLRDIGVGPSDRVGICLSKSIDAVAAIFGVLKSGAAYVPVDADAPLLRNAYILRDCGVRAAIVEQRFAEPLAAELGADLPLVELTAPLDGNALGRTLRHEFQGADTGLDSDPDATAYILYTSGSTGKPKGVVLSHENALSFVDWCSETFEPTRDDRFSSHAPFHFDLSILDIYVPLKHAATLVLIGSRLGKDPLRLASFISEHRITCWYSTPTVLSLLVQYGSLEKRDLSSLRLVSFAGEVFPVGRLRELQKLLPHPRYFNLYGPTETNVCTYYEIRGEIPEERVEPYPIGKVCEHLQSRVVDENGADIARGEEGELCMQGPGVMRGYWNRPEQTESVFLKGEGAGWYKTGDLVVEDDAGDYLFRGRRDRMVKKRGFRLELGEIEACLDSHPEIGKAAVIALPYEDGIQIKAFATPRAGGKLSVIALKGFCSQRLPSYMTPDRFSFQPELPMTSTDKIDYQKLKELD
jgi:amino acid adenylation domain-containing protein